MLFNRLAHKSGLQDVTTSQYGGRDNSPWQLGVGISQDEVIHNLNQGITTSLGAH